jgi:Tfp pilus assembly protein PilO
MSRFSNISLKYKILAANGGILLALICGVYFIVLPNIEEIDLIQEDIYQARLDLEQKYQRSQSLKKLSANLKSIEGKIENIDQVFISQNRELEFITALEQTAEKQNVTQKILLGKAKAAAGDKLYKKIPVQIQAQGNYLDMVKYLQGLETLNYYVNIRSIDLSGNGGPQRQEFTADTGSSKQVTASIIADSYWR